MGNFSSRPPQPPHLQRQRSFLGRRTDDFCDALQRAETSQRHLEEKARDDAAKNKPRQTLKAFKAGGIFALYLLSFKIGTGGTVSWVLGIVDTVGAFGVITASTAALGCWIKFRCLGPPEWRLTCQALNHVMEAPKTTIQNAYNESFVGGLVVSIMAPIVVLPLALLTVCFVGILDVLVEAVPVFLAMLPVGAVIWAVSHWYMPPSASFVIKTCVGRAAIFGLVAAAVS